MRGLKYGIFLEALGGRGVAPHTGAWIEIITSEISTAAPAVAPHTGAWIEIVDEAQADAQKQSHPIRVRGLK